MDEPQESGRDRRRIVVGVDGSPGAQHALEWAIAEAQQRGVELRVVAVWQYPQQWAEGFNPLWAQDEAFFEKEARDAAGDAVRRALHVSSLPEWVDVRTERGVPARVLLDQAADAALLVVGTRGLGGFSGLLLGSVSTACVHHATCPVTVVPSPAETGRQPTG